MKEAALKAYYPLEGTKDLDPLLEKIGNSNYVLLGEASHGTHEYYTWRIEISKRLIEEKGFSFIAVEGDWPDCYQINRWIKGYPDADDKILTILRKFKRWPTWMWANWEIAALAEWMRDYNSPLPTENKIGFYGIDVYSLWESMELIFNYLKKEDPKTAKLARMAISCFEPFHDEESYVNSLAIFNPDCREEVVKLLQSVRKNASFYNGDPEGGLNAEINALVTANAEKYYRSMISFQERSWNVRDHHMVETLNSLMKFHGDDAKVIIWEHNTHIGDARATEMARQGLLNVGQLVREQHGNEGVFIVGFGSYKGSVIAGRQWGAPMEKMEIPKAKFGSIEKILHKDFPKNKLIILDEPDLQNSFFHDWRAHRAIGVVYNPERERGNYVDTKLAERYNAFIYLDETMALHPLHIEPDGHLIPETYPFTV